MPEPRTCLYCEQAPKGIEGHSALGLQVTGVKAPGAIYKCAVCNSAWNRTYEGSGVFAWINVTGTVSEEPIA